MAFISVIDLTLYNIITLYPHVRIYCTFIKIHQDTSKISILFSPFFINFYLLSLFHMRLNIKYCRNLSKNLLEPFIVFLKPA